MKLYYTYSGICDTDVCVGTFSTFEELLEFHIKTNPLTPIYNYPNWGAFVEGFGSEKKCIYKPTQEQIEEYRKRPTRVEFICDLLEKQKERLNQLFSKDNNCKFIVENYIKGE